VRDPFFVWHATQTDIKLACIMIAKPTLYGMLLMPALLCGCAAEDEQQGLSSGEEQQLEDAATALDEAQEEFETAIQQPVATDETEEQTDH